LTPPIGARTIHHETHLIAQLLMPLHLHFNSLSLPLVRP
jgi:hypothetical protein